MRRTVFFSSLLILIGAGVAPASLDVAVNDTGISFGNSPEFRGLRINWADRHVRRVSGVNVTLWKAG